MIPNFNKEVSRQLSESLKIVGELQPVVVCQQHPDRVLVGRHRKGVGFISIQQYDVEYFCDVNSLPHELGEEIVRWQGNIQRKVSAGERRAQFAEICRLFEDSGVPKKEVAQRVANLHVFPSTTVRRYAPEEFKQPEKVKAGKASAKARSVPTWEQEAEPPEKKFTASPTRGHDDEVFEAAHREMSKPLEYEFKIGKTIVVVRILQPYSIPKDAIEVELR
ncbi:MAG: hypothetical protein ACLP9K_04290 [Nitrososphaerales archaeon]